jgi:hypothetical protein
LRKFKEWRGSNTSPQAKIKFGETKMERAHLARDIVTEHFGDVIGVFPLAAQMQKPAILPTQISI